MIQLNNISKTYLKYATENTPVLNNINLFIKENEKVAIMGASGSGKSTLLNIIGCMDKFTSGEYLLDGISIEKLKENQLDNVRKKYISMVFQNFALLNHNTVYENIEFPLIARGIKKDKRKEIVYDYMEKLEIKNLANKLPIHISGGQQQRCAIARTLVTDSKIILADEPTGALDYNRGMEIMDILCSIKDRTIIIVTHNEEIAAKTERIIRIVDGRI